MINYSLRLLTSYQISVLRNTVHSSEVAVDNTCHFNTVVPEWQYSEAGAHNVTAVSKGHTGATSGVIVAHRIVSKVTITLEARGWSPGHSDVVRITSHYTHIQWWRTGS